MAHEIEQQQNGTHSFVAAREPAWHRLGKVYADRTGLTLDEILADLNVGELITGPVLGQGNHGALIPMPGVKMVIRDRGGYDQTPLGIVGQDYTVIDERTAFGFLDAIADTGEASFQTGMLLKGGTRAVATMKLSNGILIGGVDPVDLFLCICTSHDGSLALTAFATPVRVVCQNTLTWGLAAAVQKWSVRHTKNAAKAMTVEEARRNLDLTYAYADEFSAEAEKLINTEMTKQQFESIVANLYAPKTLTPTKFAATTWDGVWAQHMELWEADTQANVKGTAWAGLNALTEYVDWFRGVRQPGEDVDAYRFERALSEQATPEKNKIHDKVLAFAGI